MTAMATLNGNIVRHTSSNPCLVCGGSDSEPRGQGVRCHGYRSGDYVYCSREEHAGKAARSDGADAWKHKLRGPCRCGIEHAPGDSKPRTGKASTTKPRKEYGPIDKIYSYRDVDGTVLHQTVRYRDPKHFTQRRPDGHGGYVWSLNGVQTILYRRPELMAREIGSTVFISEGEKDVDNLYSVGLIATTNPMGAGKDKWQDRYSIDLRGHHVVILPDNDDRGRKHGQQVARSVSPHAASVKVIELEGLPPKGDVSDWLNQGHTADELLELVKRSLEWQPDAPASPLTPDRGQADADSDDDVNEAPDDPHRLARLYVDQHRIEGESAIHFYRDECFRWLDGAYRAIPNAELRSSLNQAIKREFDENNRRDILAWEKRGRVDENSKACGKPTARKVTASLVNNVMLALQSMATLPGKADAPFWIDGNGRFPASEVMPTKNAIVHLPGVVFGDQADPDRFTIAPTPGLFASYSVDFNFDLDADQPREWLKFLESIWPDDQESIDALQEWFGYLLTPDTRQQKIGLFIGPTRSGRGTISRLITAIVGKENVANPRLSHMASTFGLQPLLAKQLAIVGDARLDGRVDGPAIVECLLAISGEDDVTVDRKHMTSWTGRLPTRIMICSNELPKLRDQSGALAGRFLAWRFTKSFLGNEDHELDNKLAVELPSVLNWAVEGRKRLHARGRFRQPESGLELLKRVREIGGPVGTFVEERCDIGTGPEYRVDLTDLFREWCEWCLTKNVKPGTEMMFGRDLHAAHATLETKQRRTPSNGIVRYYRGIRLKNHDCHA